MKFEVMVTRETTDTRQITVDAESEQGAMMAVESRLGDIFSKVPSGSDIASYSFAIRKLEGGTR